MPSLLGTGPGVHYKSLKTNSFALYCEILRAIPMKFSGSPSAFIYECKRELLIRKSRPSVPPSHAGIV